MTQPSLAKTVTDAPRQTVSSPAQQGKKGFSLTNALARMRGRDIGIVLQSFQLLPTMTAIET